MWIKLPDGLRGDGTCNPVSHHLPAHVDQITLTFHHICNFVALRQQCEEEHKVTFFQGEL